MQKSHLARGAVQQKFGANPYGAVTSYGAVSPYTSALVSGTGVTGNVAAIQSKLPGTTGVGGLSGIN